jgi:L-ribulose-5-phosphate 3-epimerase UlaE
MTTQLVKQRLGGSHIGKENDKQLRKLFLAIQADLAALQTVQNNVIDGLNNVAVQVVALHADIVKVSNNTNAANNTVQITAAAPTINLNAVSALNTQP